MRKRLIQVSSLFIFLLISEFILKLSGYETTRESEKKHIITTKPNNLIIADKFLGWKLMKGHFSTFVNRRKVNYTINSSRHRITTVNNYSVVSKNKMFIMGCSFTFGQSVSDDKTFPFLLQNDLKDYRVSNFGNPGYSLIQMIIQLKPNIRKHC